MMNRMFKPKAIAVVGASESEGKIGNSVMKNLVNGGFEGEIYPINPKAETILGKKAYNDIADLPDGVDLAVFCIPAKFVVDAIAQVGDKGIAGRGPHPVRLRRDGRGGAPAHSSRRPRASTASASSGRTSTASTTCRRR